MTAEVTPLPTQPETTKRRTRAFKGGGPDQGKAGPLVKVTVAVMCLIWTVPTLGLFITSFRQPEKSLSTGWWTVFKDPTGLTIQNYKDVLTGNGAGQTPTTMAEAFVNSLVVAIPATVLPITIAAFAAYAFTFMKFPFRDTLFVVVVGLLVIPNQVAFVPMFKIYNELGLNGTFVGVWLLHAGFGMPLAIFILRNYMASLPNSVIESAKIDGAGHFTIFWRLIIPMSVPALASFAIFQFLWVWNDYVVALIFLGQGPNSVMTVNLASLLGAQGQGWQLITAGAFVTMVLPLVVFLALQRFFIRGMTSGAVKG